MPEPSSPSPLRRTAPDPARSDLGLPDGLVQLAFLIHSALGQVAAEHDLSVIQLRMLGVLRDRTPGMQELARHLGLDKSSMTGLVTRAERRGLVQRHPDPDDRRSVRVALTDAGHEVARIGAGEAGRRIGEFTAALTESQRAELSRLTSAIVLPHTAI